MGAHFFRYPSCDVPSLLLMILVQENGRRRSQLSGAIVYADVRRERGHVKWDKDRPERSMNHAEMEDPCPNRISR
jgi:hypothetical protein